MSAAERGRANAAESSLDPLLAYLKRARAFDFTGYKRTSLERRIRKRMQEVGATEPIRVWCAGCASGEETYTMAMVLAEALGEEAYMARVKIYATEVDDDALQQARRGTYTAKQVETIPPRLLERHFERSEGRYAVNKDMRRTVIFGRNDLTRDA